MRVEGKGGHEVGWGGGVCVGGSFRRGRGRSLCTEGPKSESTPP